jgi:transcriptional regulator with XRE-family HTH domain
MARKRFVVEAKLRTSQSNVCKWERGHNTPRPNTLTRIAEALCCSEHELTP